jgi:hypothetical protein
LVQISAFAFFPDRLWVKPYPFKQKKGGENLDLARWAYLLLAKIVHFKKTLKARFSSATDGVSGALPYSLQGRLATFYGLECRGWAVVKSMHFMHTFEPQL